MKKLLMNLLGFTKKLSHHEEIYDYLTLSILAWESDFPCEKYKSITIYGLPILIKLAAKEHNIEAIDTLLKPAFELYLEKGRLSLPYQRYFSDSALAWRFMFDAIFSNFNKDEIGRIIETIDIHIDIREIRAARNELILSLININISLVNLHLFKLEDFVSFLEQKPILKYKLPVQKTYSLFTKLFPREDISKFMKLLIENQEDIPDVGEIYDVFNVQY